MREHLHDYCLQLGVRPRLAYEPEDACFVDGTDDSFHVCTRAQDDPRRIRLQLLHARQKRHAVHYRHAVIGDHEIDVMVGHVLERLDRRGARCQLRIGQRRERCGVEQHPPQCAQNVRLVVDDEKMGHDAPLCTADSAMKLESSWPDMSLAPSGFKAGPAVLGRFIVSGGSAVNGVVSYKQKTSRRNGGCVRGNRVGPSSRWDGRRCRSTAQSDMMTTSSVSVCLFPPGSGQSLRGR